MGAYSNARKAVIKQNSKVIKANLRRMDITLAELARHFGIKPPSFSQAIASDVSLSTLQGIAEYCHCTVEELITPYRNNKDIVGYIEHGDDISRINSVQDLYNILTELKYEKAEN